MLAAKRLYPCLRSQEPKTKPHSILKAKEIDSYANMNAFSFLRHSVAFYLYGHSYTRYEGN